jgi:hypothetical protein
MVMSMYQFQTSYANVLKGQFYRVQVGVQSPEGATTIRGVLKRFNDFMKLFTDVSSKFLLHFITLIILLC